MRYLDYPRITPNLCSEARQDVAVEERDDYDVVVDNTKLVKGGRGDAGGLTFEYLSAPQNWACIGRALGPALKDALVDSNGVTTEGEIPILFLTENQRVR